MEHFIGGGRSKTVGKLSFKSGASCLLRLGELSSKVGRVIVWKWGELSWGEFYVGRVVLGASCLWGELSVIRYSLGCCNGPECFANELHCVLLQHVRFI